MTLCKCCAMVLTTYLVAFGWCLQTPALGGLWKASGTSAKEIPVSFEAEMTISGDFLTVKLSNTSPTGTLNPDDTLGSFYFDILRDGTRPTLAYISAAGDVYLASQQAPDVLQAAGADIQAVDTGDYSWMFKAMDAAQAPGLGFGIGTVGNSGLAPNNFSGAIVDGIDYSIYTGEITTRNLDGKLLVKDSATFTFSGLTGFTEADIQPTVLFGLGTAPDSTLPGIQTPVPGALALVMCALTGIAGWRFTRRRPGTHV